MTEIFVPEDPPLSNTEEGRRMSEYIARMMRNIQAEFDLPDNRGHGGLITRTATAMPNIAALAWETIPYDTGQASSPINVRQDPTNNRFAVDENGEWTFSFYITFECAKNAANDRIINWRLYDETAGAPFSPDPFPVYVENNSNFGHSSATAIVTIDDSIKNHWFRVELGGSSLAFSGITLEKSGLSIIEIHKG